MSPPWPRAPASKREWHDNGKLKIEVSTVEGSFAAGIDLAEGRNFDLERFYLHGRAVLGLSICGQSGSTRICQRYRIARTRNGFRSARRIELRAHETHVEGMLERGTWREVRQSLGPAEESRFPSLGRFPSVRAALGFGESLYAAGARGGSCAGHLPGSPAVNSRTGSWFGCRERRPSAGESDAHARFSKAETSPKVLPSRDIGNPSSPALE